MVRGGLSRSAKELYAEDMQVEEEMSQVGRCDGHRYGCYCSMTGRSAIAALGTSVAVR
jgi:hypothetical protein